MCDSKHQSFLETRLPLKYRGIYEFMQQAHLLEGKPSYDLPGFHVYHPCKMAEELMQLRLGDEAVQAGMLHDVVEATPVMLEHLDPVIEPEVQELLFQISWPLDMQFNAQGKASHDYLKHLNKACYVAQAVKLVDIIQTLIIHGTYNHEVAVRYAQAIEPVIEVMHPKGSVLKEKARYIRKWALRVAYEHQVNNYDLKKEKTASREAAFA